MKKIFVLAALAFAGCVPGNFHYVSDNKRVDEDPARMKQIEVDKVICNGEAAKANLSQTAQAQMTGTSIQLVYEGCMAGKGYIVRR
jgi:hypothetical protein